MCFVDAYICVYVFEVEVYSYQKVIETDIQIYQAKNRLSLSQRCKIEILLFYSEVNYVLYYTVTNAGNIVFAPDAPDQPTASNIVSGVTVTAPNGNQYEVDDS